MNYTFGYTCILQAEKHNKAENLHKIYRKMKMPKQDRTHALYDATPPLYPNATCAYSIYDIFGTINKLTKYL